MKDRSRRSTGYRLILLSGLALVGAVPLPAAAQADNENQESEKSQVEVVVTGSLLPTTPDQVAVPITTLDAKTMEQNGVNSNPMVLASKIVPGFPGPSNTRTTKPKNPKHQARGVSTPPLWNL